MSELISVIVPVFRAGIGTGAAKDAGLPQPLLKEGRRVEGGPRLPFL